MAGVDEKKQPIIVKKIKKGGHGHHGGAWKVAYADFVTAMMAFFLLMWLLGSTSEGTKAGLSEFFQNPSAVAGPGGASTSMIDFGGELDVPRNETQNPLDSLERMSAEELAELLEDKARLDDLMKELQELIENSEALREFKDQLLIDITSEGLRIQIVDKENRPMFDLGSTVLKSYTKKILHVLAQTINQVPNHISVAGHTDAKKFVIDREDYSNWELSANRANAARRELQFGGLDDNKTGRVVGLADSVMFKPEDPYDPINRRISIIVLNRMTERAIGLTPLEEKPKEEKTPLEKVMQPKGKADKPLVEPKEEVSAPKVTTEAKPTAAKTPESLFEAPKMEYPDEPAPRNITPLKPVIDLPDVSVVDVPENAAQGDGLEQALSRILGPPPAEQQTPPAQ